MIVMKDGRIVESGKRNQIFNEPQHEYTQKLLSFVDKSFKEKLKNDSDKKHVKDPNQINWNDALLIRRRDV